MLSRCAESTLPVTVHQIAQGSEADAQGSEASELWVDASCTGRSAVGPASDAQYCIMALSGIMLNQRHWAFSSKYAL